MSGHSKWHNIQRRKGKQDSVRGQLFTRLSRDVYQAAKEGGGNPETNFRLKVALDRAKVGNLPADTVARTIAKATGTLEGVTYEELQYEGYGPHGVALLMDIVTDNRNRTAADVRHIFRKRGGTLGETGTVAWMFRRIGQIEIARRDVLDADELMLIAIDAGAQEVEEVAEGFVITTSPQSFQAVRAAVEGAGVTYEEARLTYEATVEADLEPTALDDVFDLIEALEAYDDVQAVYSNARFDEDEDSKREA